MDEKPTTKKAGFPVKAKWVLASWFILTAILWSVLWTQTGMVFVEKTYLYGAIAFTIGYALYAAIYTIKKVKQSHTSNQPTTAC